MSAVGARDVAVAGAAVATANPIDEQFVARGTLGALDARELGLLPRAGCWLGRIHGHADEPWDARNGRRRWNDDDES